MSGITDLQQLLRSMKPELTDQVFVFCTVPGNIGDFVSLTPIASFAEQEGLTLVLARETAERAGLQFDGVFRQITLTVHSSLAAVGLTAAVAAKLAAKGISANVIAAYYHDHIFVPADRAEAALRALQEFSV
ncbi:ACT domain-containing protein [Microbulbifer sp. SA54]|uniref:ACT domain-containing protein n=1 Tax=Microbulbifer sp. SA54 TaxID=3401577 RepID=UPI003AAD733E